VVGEGSGGGVGGDEAGDLQGEVEGGGGLAAGDLGLAAGAGAVGEGGKLAAEGFVLLDGHGFLDDLGAGAAEDLSCLFLVVEGQVAIFLEHADLAEFLWADSRGGDIGDAAVLEAEAGIGDVLAAGEDWHAYGVDGHDGGADEVEDDLEVMDHEVQHHADICGAVGEGREAVCLDEARVGEAVFEFGQHGVEAFDMADLEDAACLMGELDQGEGVSELVCDGFFHEHVEACMEELGSDIEVGGGGGGDGGGVAACGELLEGRGGGVGEADLSGHLVELVRAGVPDRGELDAREGGEDSGVVSADGTDADHADADGLGSGGVVLGGEHRGS
jgi:hypothetical protein